MALTTTIGDKNATSGMSKKIYDALRAEFEPGIGAAGEEDKKKMLEGWQKLAYAIAYGVTQHVIAEMEISDITVDEYHNQNGLSTGHVS